MFRAFRASKFSIRDLDTPRDVQSVTTEHHGAKFRGCAPTGGKEMTTTERPWWQPEVTEGNRMFSLLLELVGGGSSPDEVAFFARWREPVWQADKAAADKYATDMRPTDTSERTLVVPVPENHPAFDSGYLVYLESASWRAKQA